MIRRLKVKGYKSLKNVEVHFSPLTVIFGPNAAGKSNLLDALNLISRVVTRKNLKEAFDGHRGLPLESFFYGDKGPAKLREQGSAQAEFEVDVELSQGTVAAVERLIAEKRRGTESEEKPKRRITERILRYAFTIEMLTTTGHLRVRNERLAPLKRNGEEKARNAFLEKGPVSDKDGKEKLHLRMEGQAHPTYFDLGLDHTIISTALYEPHYPHISAFRHELSTWCFYYFEPRTLMREDVPLAEMDAIGPRGENLAAFLNTLRANDGRKIEAFNLALKHLLPSIDGVEIEPTKDGLLSMRVIEGGMPYSSRVISEGTLRVLGLLAALHPSSPSTVVGYEEPENGVHPARLKLVADLFKNTQENYGKQIIVNTHSPVFPGFFEDCSLLVCRKEGAASRFDPFSSTGSLFGREDIRSEEITKGLEEAILRGDYGS